MVLPDDVPLWRAGLGAHRHLLLALGLELMGLAGERTPKESNGRAKKRKVRIRQRLSLPHAPIPIACPQGQEKSPGSLSWANGCPQKVRQCLPGTDPAWLHHTAPRTGWLQPPDCPKLCTSFAGAGKALAQGLGGSQQPSQLCDGP